MQPGGRITYMQVQANYHLQFRCEKVCGKEARATLRIKL